MENESDNQKFIDCVSFINDYSPYMNDFLYVLDFKHNIYQISKTALDRFKIPADTFSNLNENFKKFVYPEDYKSLMEDIEILKRGLKKEHSIRYRWIG